jgi:hypothetical protein
MFYQLYIVCWFGFYFIFLRPMKVTSFDVGFALKLVLHNNGCRQPMTQLNSSAQAVCAARFLVAQSVQTIMMTVCCKLHEPFVDASVSTKR